MADGMEYDGMKKKERNVQQWLSFLLLVLTLGVVLYIGLSGNELADLTAAIRRLTPVSILLCILSWGLYVLFDALAIYHFLIIQNHRIKLRRCLHAAIVGIYYCNITPGASGGQPMEMYCLSKHGVPVGISGSGMAVKFIFFQATLLVTGAVLWIGNATFVYQYIDGSQWFVLLGYVANFFTIGLVILMAVSQKAVRWMIEKCIVIGVKLHICKNPEASRAKWENHCVSFLNSVQMVMKHPRDMVVQCLIALGQLMSLMIVIIVVYHALGLSGVSTIQLITLGVLLYIAASYVPLPGASGAQEGGFVSLFKFVFPDAQRFVALLIWRFTTYYLSILVGAVVTTAESLHGMRSTHATEKKKNL